MTKVLFESETEIGRCEFQSQDPQAVEYSLPGYATLYAYTRATLNGSQGLLKIEQNCFLRQGEDVPDQPWVRPEMIIEPAPTCPQEMIQMARTAHELFIARARQKLPERLLV